MLAFHFSQGLLIHCNWLALLFCTSIWPELEGQGALYMQFYFLIAAIQYK